MSARCRVGWHQWRTRYMSWADSRFHLDYIGRVCRRCGAER